MSRTSGKWVKSICALSVFAFVLTGCAGGPMGALNSGSEKYDQAYLKQNIIPGKTTKDDVMRLFGAPYTQELNSTSGKNGNESNWTYNKSQEGIDKYMTLAHKYLPTGSSLQMYDAQAQVGKAKGVGEDVQSVTGTAGKPNDKSGSILTIYFVDNVVKYYRLY
ncbi:hypothetical protein RJO15_24375 [Herbaspirillum huttiense F1]|uniref:Beta-barrel assembly machine subunit BamE n=1 Tax=Herbaspirillum huttiense subsp. lycopersici TaxID=3074428 RepID=A0ABU2ERJ3_9BURK|nr:hypothetical protein [Herbaspirillum huttiense]MDR9850785.1 hypothetical protein [Herbaspirillum huttiense SE1]MDT0358946.1 hypothetical protein [Herbaspirillum huttiense F1]